MVRAAAFLLLIANAAFGQSGIVSDAADYALSTATPLAPGSLAIISYAWSASGPNTNGRLHAIVSIRPAGATTVIPAQVIAATIDTITFVIPPDVPPGSAQLIYRAEGDTTKWLPIAIIPASFSLFRTGTPGPLVAQQMSGNGSVSANGLATPTQTGQTVVLWGSGLGATTAANIGVTLGGVAQTILYAGPSPSVPGVDQINFRVTPGTPDGCYVPLTVTYGQSSFSSFLSKSPDGSACMHPFRLSINDLKLLDSGGALSVGQISTSSTLQIASADHAARVESVTVSVESLNAQQLASSFMSAAPTACGIQVPAQAGFLYSTALLQAGGNPFFTDFQTISKGIEQIKLTDVSPGETYQSAIPSTADAPLTGVPAPALAGGNWTWSWSGGPISPSPAFGFNLPPPIQIVGGAPLILTRDRDQTITWDGNAYDPTAMVTLTIAGSGPAAARLTCAATARSGAITIAATLLSKMSASAATLSVQLSEAPSTAGFARFRQKDGTTLLMYVAPTSSDIRPADIQ